MSIKVKCNPNYREDNLIFEAVEASNSFENITEANRYFMSLCENVTGFVKLENNVYRYKDYFINIGIRFTMAAHAENVLNLARLELSCIPEGVAYIWLDNDHDMVLFTRIQGSEDRRLIPYSDVAKVSAEAKQMLLADVERIMEENYAVLAVTEGKGAWHVIEVENRIVLSHCSLAFVSEAAKPAYRKRVLEALDL